MLTYKERANNNNKFDIIEVSGGFNLMNLQDNFLNVARKENAELEITLVTGKTFKGHVKGFDNFTVIVFSGDKQNMIYKHAIAHIQMDKTNPKLEIKPYTSARKPTQRSEKKSKAPEKEQEKEKFNSIDFSNVKLQND